MTYPVATVSCFAGRENKTAIEAWKSYLDVTGAFLTLADNPSVVSDVCMEHIERFVVSLYDRTSGRKSVSDARKPLFDQKGRAPDAIPPRAAFVEHTTRVVDQAGYCWGQVLTPNRVLLSPHEWEMDHG